MENRMYFQAPTFQENALNPDIMRYIFMAFVMLFSLASLFFLPIDFAAIQMSFDPGFGLFGIIVLVIFGVKIVCLLDFHFILFGGANAYNVRALSTIIQIVGISAIGLSLLIVGVEIGILTKNFLAIIVHPFVLDFGLFVICSGLSFFVINEAPKMENLPIAYMPISQQSKINYPMMQISSLEPQLVQAPVQAPVQVPVQPVPPQVKYPELELHQFNEPVMMVQPAPQVMPIRYIEMQAQPQPVKLIDQPKTVSGTFLPYYIKDQK